MDRNEVAMNGYAVLPDIQDIRNVSTAWCAVAFEELNSTIGLIGQGIESMTPMQRTVFERYKVQTKQFGHDMLLAEKHHEEIKRRLELT
jgi:hypothetical protein